VGVHVWTDKTSRSGTASVIGCRFWALVHAHAQASSLRADSTRAACFTVQATFAVCGIHEHNTSTNARVCAHGSREGKEATPHASHDAHNSCVQARDTIHKRHSPSRLRRQAK
jgi:hypothetical protein